MRAFRGTTAGQIVSGIPRAVFVIMAICLLGWMVMVATWQAPFWSFLKLVPSGILRGRVWQFVTYQFLHDPRGVLHLVFNMLNLYFFGRWLEARWGIREFVTFYLTCGVGGGLLFLAVALVFGSDAPLIGASAAVLGVLVACAMIWPYQVISLLGLVSIQLRHLVLIVVGLDLLYAWLGVAGGRSPVGPVAHLGGVATGWVYVHYGLRLSRIGGIGRGIAGAFHRVKWSWRKRRMKVVERDWERILEEEDDKDTRH